MAKKKVTKYVNLKDIVIPAGTVFSEGAVETAWSEPPFEHIIGFGPDGCGHFTLSIEDIKAAGSTFTLLKE